MDVRQSLVMAIRNLQANKLRFAQTMLGLVRSEERRVGKECYS